MAGTGLVNVDLGAVVGQLGGLATQIRSAITGDISPDAKAKLQEAALQAEQLVDQAQNAVNAIEAQSPSVFKSGWRPACAWLCVFGLAWSTILKSGIEWGFALAGKMVILPAIDTSVLTTLLVGLLGLGTMRVVEKINGVASN